MPDALQRTRDLSGAVRPPETPEVTKPHHGSAVIWCIKNSFKNKGFEKEMMK